ncbi:MAG: hypothetical protein HQK50_03465 [Oligoflexia bacterium]|nr:hypothetical protein [Oligoflexia bacterium]
MRKDKKSSFTLFLFSWMMVVLLNFVATAFAEDTTPEIVDSTLDPVDSGAGDDSDVSNPDEDSRDSSDGAPSPKLPSSYKALLEYVLPAPLQHQGSNDNYDYVNAGSCFFMAATGAMEILMNMDVAPENRQSDGLSDLSERWLMTVPEVASRGNFIVNRILTFNDYAGGVLNKDYRYTKGGYNEYNYSVRHNWVNELPGDWEKKILVKTPKIETKVIFMAAAPGAKNKVGVMSDRTIEKVKQHLVEKQGPVQVVYNESGVWHSVLIVGYDDNDTMDGEVKECPFTKKTIRSLGFFHRWKAKRAMARGGGCEEKGVFYVRESEYHENDPFYQKLDKVYDYDLQREGEEAPYAAPFVKREYEWLKYLGNHAVGISRVDVDKARFPPKKNTPTP